ncbi:MAG: bifunctional UDP-N-acetylglucosamine diphosphorylase/glucosamine-1-phosphate N-acetyltransferase GlmU [Chloroflexota bacterium]|nr:bifunctional UDP-N-acetylglucosamine diphosphorylase/glucosamine-1-phosphate N-acetyltransferase GlmU [Chloroflexota bacterium]
MKPPPPQTRTVAIVLAAGLGTRMKSRLPKVLHELCGRPMLGYVLEAARAATGQPPVVVYSPPTEAVRTAFADVAEFALQDEPRGTADALLAGLRALPEEVSQVLVVHGDVPLLEAELLSELLEAHRSADAVLSLVSVVTLDPRRLGRLVRDEAGELERIVEARDASDDQLEIDEINTGIYVIEVAWLRPRIADLRPSPATGELYLTELVGLARADGRPVATVAIGDDGSLLGINDRAELAEATYRLRERINEGHLLAGVTMLDPTTAYVDADVVLAADVVLEPNVSLRGRTSIGAGTTVGSGSQIIDSSVGRDCRIWASVLERSEVEDEVSIGPFAHLRAGSSIGRGAKLGNFAEVKNSRLEAGVQQHHVSYLGDAHVGARTNIGAGTITANYDGQHKTRTTIGEGAFIGVDTMLVAPVEVGDGARTGAGAVVTRDVPPGKLAVGVPARIREPRRPPATDDGASDELDPR